MRVFLPVALCCLLAGGALAQRRGGGGGGGGFRGGGGGGGIARGGGVVRGGSGFGRGSFGGVGIGSLGGYRGGIGGIRGGFGGIGGGFGGFRGINRGFNFGSRAFFGFNYGYWPYAYPAFGLGLGYWPGYYDSYSYYPGSYDYAPAYQAPVYQPNVTVVYPESAQAAPTNVYVQRAKPVIREYDQYGQEISPPAAESGDSSPIYLIAFKDGVIRAAASYWVAGDTLHYVTLQREEKQVALTGVDRDLSLQLNRERRVPFRLTER
jgi:hypothetical protein